MKSILVLAFVLAFSFNCLAQQNAGDLTIEPYVFENSKKEKVQAEFGRLSVPENRKKQGGKTIELAFVRFRSTSKDPGSPIVYLAGGPGGSGIDSAKGSRFGLFMAMREFGDVIALDQRGTGASKPNLRCLNLLDLPFDQGLTKESLVKAENERIRICAETWEKQGVDASAYNTVENANDLNDLRIALGAKKITLWGISYGTHLGLATIRQHGKNIDRAILAGIEATDDTLKLPGNTQKLIAELDKRARSDAELSARVPDLPALIKTVLDRLEAKPVSVEIENPRTKVKSTITIGKYDVQLIVGGYSGSMEFLAGLPKLFRDMENGDFSFVAQQIAGYRKGGFSSLMSTAMDCASGVTEKRLDQIRKEGKTALLADAVNSPFPDVCKGLNIADLGDDFRKPVVSDVSVLFISGTLDGRTPVSNAEFTINGFKNSSHLIIDGAGHSDPLFLSSPLIKETMMKFMKGDKLARIIEIETAERFKFASF